MPEDPPINRLLHRSGLVFCASMLLLAAGHPAAAPVHHDLEVSFDPDNQRLVARDTLPLPSTLTSDNGTVLRFRLHSALTPSTPTPGVVLVAEASDTTMMPPTTEYRLEIPAELHSVTLDYEGRIHDPVRLQPGDQARGVAGSSGLISTEGIYLGPASLWYPRIDGEQLSFSLELRLPPGWDAVSQGKRTLHRREPTETRVRWEESNPQTGIYLSAGPYHEYHRQFGEITAMAFLRDDEPELAERYLEATGRYLAMFGDLLGPYPYSKFALVENFWESGYGMPSFTLLGSTVIRLPFIVHTSYPHEILHNWWGNGVYVDYSRGNWAEGLTAYLADHLLQEQRGNGAEMRRNHLQRYADYVDEAKDFPLIDFNYRHSPATEAVGYGKSLMFFHMLRRQLGDEAFLAGLRDFYRQQLFAVADFEDLRTAFAPHADSDLRTEFRQWTIRSGAPRLEISEVHTRELEDGGHELTMVLEQLQPGLRYQLRVPLVIALQNRPAPLEREVEFDEARQRFRLALPARPLRVEVDPRFDLFRRVDRREIPPALSQALGTERLLAVLPAGADQALRDEYRALVDQWYGTRNGTQYRVVADDEIDTLPEDRTVWLFGWNNRFVPELRNASSRLPVQYLEDRLELPGESLLRGEDSAVMIARIAGDPELAFGWLASDDPRVVAGLTRRLPHYGKYGYLGFAGDRAENILRGQWPVVDSPLAVTIPAAGGRTGDEVPPLEYPRRPPLTELQ